MVSTMSRQRITIFCFGLLLVLVTTLLPDRASSQLSHPLANYIGKTCSGTVLTARNVYVVTQIDGQVAVHQYYNPMGGGATDPEPSLTDGGLRPVTAPSGYPEWAARFNSAAGTLILLNAMPNGGLRVGISFRGGRNDADFSCHPTS